MAVIKLTGGYECVVDDADFAWLSQWKWQAKRRADGAIYAVRGGVRHGSRLKTTVQMHRLILDAPDDLLVDHADRNTLNNSRSNLRLATKAQSNMNRKVRGREGRKGVYRRPGRPFFYSYIKVGGRNLFLGSFTTAEEAARAYDAAARKYFGEFACTNDSSVCGLHECRPVPAVCRP